MIDTDKIIKYVNMHTSEFTEETIVEISSICGEMESACTYCSGEIMTDAFGGCNFCSMRRLLIDICKKHKIDIVIEE